MNREGQEKDIYQVDNEKVVPYLGTCSPEFLPWAAGITYRDPGYHIRRFNGSHYVFECVLSGKGQVDFNGEFVSLSAGDAYLLHPNTFHHYYSNHHDPWVKIWFNVQGSLVRHLLSDYRLNTNCYIRGLNNSDYLAAILEKLEKEPAHCKNELALLLHHHISIFSGALNSLIQESSAALAMKNYIDQRLTQPVSIDEIAAYVHLSRSRALHLFKEEFNMTPYHYYLSQRLELAQNMLRSSRLPVQEISGILGFPDYHHFASLFKRRTGMTPSQFRDS